MDNIQNRLIKYVPQFITPNKLSWFRLFTIIPILAAAFSNRWLIVLILYCVSVLTDAVDGALARQRKETSRLGAALDPFADKALNIPLFLFMFPSMPLLVIGVVSIDVFIACAYLYLKLTHNKELPLKGASTLGKMKMFFQVLSLLTFLISRIADYNLLFNNLIIILLWMTFVCGIFSILQYILLLRIKKY